MARASMAFSLANRGSVPALALFASAWAAGLVGLAAVLLPILQGAHAHAQQARKIGLGAIGVQINPSANPAGTAERSTGPRSRTSGSKARNWTI